ncbi:MAG: M15 family metallopeptidase [Bacteroidetes bacterium]|nr:M15 family metallopeptidase [Bacteroidota bacterium]
MALLTDAEVIKAFGVPGNPDNFTIIQLPYPMRIAWDLKTQVTKMQCHELAEYRFLSVFKDLLTHYGWEEIKKLGIDIFGGCVNVRLMRGSKTKWSRHAWGIAIDLDPARNGLKTSWANSQFSKKEYEPMHQIFEMYGFLNYGKVKGFDSMHYELCK